MIQANELAKGNYIKVFGSLEIIDGVVNELVYYTKGSIQKSTHIKDISGVPLTYKILDQCGFEEMPNGSLVLKCGVFSFMPFTAHLQLCAMLFDAKGEYVSVWATTLHKLQNLYFVLKGNELEIKKPLSV